MIRDMNTTQTPPRPVVHLELHTRDRARAGAFYASLLHWRPELIAADSCSYLALGMGAGLDGGIVECGTPRTLWLPYVEVDRVDDATERARRLGAAVLLEPREGPSGRRCVISTPEAGEVALWERRR
jgi:predicted enzyme related to lactoylglutathione lyase